MKETNSCEQMKEKLKEPHTQGMKKVRQKRVTCRMWNSSLRYACLLISLQFHDW